MIDWEKIEKSLTEEEKAWARTTLSKVSYLYAGLINDKIYTARAVAVLIMVELGDQRRLRVIERLYSRLGKLRRAYNWINLLNYMRGEKEWKAKDLLNDTLKIKSNPEMDSVTSLPVLDEMESQIESASSADGFSLLNVKPLKEH
jgi:hypothetical protein